MAKQVATFTHAPASIVAGSECELIYADGVPIFAVIRDGGAFLVRKWTDRGTLGMRVASRHEFKLAFEAACRHALRHGMVS